MKIRNPQHTADGRIDCEIEHPVHGWIPFTADPNDIEEHGRQIHADILASGAKIAPYEPPPDPDPAEALAREREGMVCSRFQAKAALLQAGLLDQVEAVLAEADPVAKLAWADAVEFRRNSPTIAALAKSVDMTDEQVDDLFRAAKKIRA